MLWFYTLMLTIGTWIPVVFFEQDPRVSFGMTVGAWLTTVCSEFLKN